MVRAPANRLGLHALLTALRQAGLRVGVAETERIRALLSAEVSPDAARLRVIVTRILVRTDEERALVDRVTAAWLDAAEADLLEREPGLGELDGEQEKVAPGALPRSSSKGSPAPAPATRPRSPRFTPAPASPSRLRRSWVIRAAAALVILVSFGAVVWVARRPAHLPESPEDAGVTAVPSATPSATAAPAASATGTPEGDAGTGPDRGTVDPGPDPRHDLDWARYSLLGLAGLVLAALAFRAWSTRVVLPGPEPSATGGGKPSFGLMLPGVAIPPLLDAAELRSIGAAAGRFTRDEPSRDLDVEATVRATAWAGGVPMVRFRPERPLRGLWLWVDGSTADPTAAELASEVLSALRRDGLPIEKALFWGVPDRLQSEDGRSFEPDIEEALAAGARVAILTDGRILGLLCDDPYQRGKLAPLLDELGRWNEVALVAFDEGRFGLQHLGAAHGLQVLRPEELAAFLAGSLGQRSLPAGEIALGGDALIWAAACALAPRAIDQATALAVRDDLGLTVPRWVLRALFLRAERVGSLLRWEGKERAARLRWLCTASEAGIDAAAPVPQGSLLDKALSFWRGRLAGEEWTARANAPTWVGSIPERQLRAERALLDLWDGPDQAVATLYCLATVEKDRSGLAAFVRRAVRGLGSLEDEGQEERVVLPWRLGDRPVGVRVMLRALGFGGREAQERTGVSPRLVLAAGVVGGLGLGGLAAWRLVGERKETTERAEINSVRVPAPDAACPDGMLWVPGGVFWMNLDANLMENKMDLGPKHTETVGSFCLDRTEVTVKSYAACAQAGICAPAQASMSMPREALQIASAKEISFENQTCNQNRPDRQDHPINCIEWKEAQNYCQWKGARLPSTKEWEYAARGGNEQREYPWGSDAPSPERLNACGPECTEHIQTLAGTSDLHKPSQRYDSTDNWTETAPVGSYPKGKGRWGHVDLAGNVAEWTADQFEFPARDTHDSLPFMPPSAEENSHTIRGDGWSNSTVASAREAFRSYGGQNRFGDVGFRCASGPIHNSNPQRRP